MSMAHVEIEAEVLKWPAAERVSLAERLLESVDGFATGDIGRAWRAEIARRVEEVESGREMGGSFFARCLCGGAQKLNEARKVSSSRKEMS